MCSRYVLLIAAVLMSSASAAQETITLYTVDTAPDSLLVRLTYVLRNSFETSVAVADIGPLGVEMRRADLAWHRGQLFALRDLTGGAPELYTIDVETGAATLVSAIVPPAGFTIVRAEGLTSNGDDLLIAWSPQSAPTSERVGVLNLDGTITGSVDTNFDIDALGYDPARDVLLLVDSGTDRFDVATLAYPQSVPVIASTGTFNSFANGGVNDVVDIGGSRVVSLSSPLPGPGLLVGGLAIVFEPGVKGPTNRTFFTDRNDPSPRAFNGVAMPIVECRADVNRDGLLDGSDFNAWLAAFSAGDSAADQNNDGMLDGSDFNAWLANFQAGCD